MHPAAEVVDAEQHAVEQPPGGLGPGRAPFWIHQRQRIAHDVHVGARGRRAQDGVHLVDAPGQQIAPCHQRRGMLRCRGESISQSESGQLVGDTGAVALVVACDDQHQSGLGESVVADGDDGCERIDPAVGHGEIQTAENRQNRMPGRGVRIGERTHRKQLFDRLFVEPVGCQQPSMGGSQLANGRAATLVQQSTQVLPKPGMAAHGQGIG